MHAAIENGLKQAERAGPHPLGVLNNHDLIRSATRFALPQVPADNGLYHAFPRDWVLRGGATYREDRAKGTQRSRAALMLEMGLPGSAYIYQGEELGLFEVADIPWNRLEDPWALHTSGANINKGRDGCRVPLPWVATDTPELDHEGDEFGHVGRHGNGTFGFTRTTDTKDIREPHLPQPHWFKDHAVDAQSADTNSMLNFYRRVVALRHELFTSDTTFAWAEELDRTTGRPDGPDGSEGGVIAYRRPGGWMNVTNFGFDPVALPQGVILLSSGPLTTDGKLPQDTSVWIRTSD